MTPVESVILTAAAGNFLIGFFVLLQSFKDRKAISFSLMGLTTGLWCLINLIVINTRNPDLIRFAYSVGILVAVMGVVWIRVFGREVRELSHLTKTFLTIISLMGLVLSILSLKTSLIISAVNTGGQLEVTQGLLFGAYSVVATSLIALAVLLSYFYHKVSRGTERSQWLYVFLGITGFAVVSSVVNFLFPYLAQFIPSLGDFSFAYLDSPSSLILIAFSAYAMMKHRLFEIKIVLTEMAAAALVLIGLEQIFNSSGYGEVIFRVIILLLTTIFGFILIKSVRNEVERREEVEGLAKEKTEALTELSERNRNLAALQRISDIVLNESEMKIMAQKILDEIPKQLESCAGALLSIVKDSQLMAYAVSEHQSSAKILSLVGGDLKKHTHPVKKDYNLTHAVLVDKEPHDSDSLSDFISPPISKAVALTIQKLTGARHFEAFPLYAGGEPFGVMMFVFTEPKDQIHEQNYSIAKAIADDMSLAIQRAQAYTKLKEANAYLADLDKLKDEFISMASHELNTPLAAIEGYLSMVLDEGLGKVDPKAKEYLNRAYDSSKRLAELILDLLNVSRIEQGRLKMKFTKTNFASLVESVIKELQLKADTKKIYLKLEAPKTNLPQTFCDPDRIREVFVNLIGNSIKFTEKGGITIKLSKPDDHIRAEVVDTGRGIAEEDQKLLFQKFSQVKREIDEHQGTGLGLYISKNFVELHKGRIGVTSEQGKGATFFFEIPIMKTAPKEVAGAMLDKPVNAAQIEAGPKGVPAIVAESSKAKA